MSDLIEAMPIADIFVTTLAKMERVGTSCMRFYFATEADGELVVQCKLIVPIDAIRQISATRIMMMLELGAAEGLVVPGDAA